MRRLLPPHRGRRLRRGHGISLQAIPIQLLVFKQQRPPSPTQVPFHVVRQHTYQDMIAYIWIQAMVDRTHQQVNPLQAAEQLLHQRQPFVRPHARLRRQPLGWLAGANHIDPVQQTLLLDRFFITRPRENTITNRQSDVLGHLVPPDHPTRLHADLRSRQRRLGPQRHAAGQLRQVLLRRGQQPLALLPPLLGQQRVEAGHQPFSWEVRLGNKGYRRYLTGSDSPGFRIDEAKVAEDARYDGKWVLRTNTELDPAEVALQYKRLWMVEHWFRSCKSLLQTRPIYHKCDETIRGHLFCSFLALVLRQELQARLEERGHELEWADVICDLDRLQVVEVEQDDKRFLLRSEVQRTCGKVFQAVGVALPPTVLQVSPVTPGQDAAHSATPSDGWVKSSPIKKMQPFTVEDESCYVESLTMVQLT